MGPEQEHAVLRLQNIRPVGRAELPERPEEHGGLLLIREARQALVFRRAPEARPQRLCRGPDETPVVVPLQNGRDGAARSGWCRRSRRRSQEISSFSLEFLFIITQNSPPAKNRTVKKALRLRKIPPNAGHPERAAACPAAGRPREMRKRAFSRAENRKKTGDGAQKIGMTVQTICDIIEDRKQ